MSVVGGHPGRSLVRRLEDTKMKWKYRSVSGALDLAGTCLVENFQGCSRCSRDFPSRGPLRRALHRAIEMVFVSIRSIMRIDSRRLDGWILIRTIFPREKSWAPPGTRAPTERPGQLIRWQLPVVAS